MVTSFTLVWIKIMFSCLQRKGPDVTSFTLVWIKIAIDSMAKYERSSRASRSCGLKYSSATASPGTAQVTSFTLVWIKILLSLEVRIFMPVTSFTLVWIKISPFHYHF